MRSVLACSRNLCYLPARAMPDDLLLAFLVISQAPYEYQGIILGLKCSLVTFSLIQGTTCFGSSPSALLETMG